MWNPLPDFIFPQSEKLFIIKLFMSSHPEVATPPENSNSDFSVEILTTVLTFKINKELFLRVTASFKTNVIVILAINQQALLC